MALKQNTTINAQYPRRWVGGTFAGERSMWSRTERLNQGLSEGLTDAIAKAVPSGHLAPSAWILPVKPGGMSAFTGTSITFTLGTLTLAEGRNLTGDVNFTFTVPGASLELVVSASGECTITWTPTGNLAGSLAAEGTTSITFTVDPTTLGAITDAIGTVGITFSGTATPYATGELSGDITPFTELSPQSLAAAVWEYATRTLTSGGGGGGGLTPTETAQAVWNALATDHNIADTMGRILLTREKKKTL